MAELSSAIGYGDRSGARPPSNQTTSLQVVDPAPDDGISGRAAQPTPKPTVSLIIPVRNEARNISWVLEQVADDVNEIILVDGNSTDATLITASSCRPDIRVVTQQGVGKGSALRTGFLAATGDIIVMMDADGSMAPQEIRHYLHFLTNGYDFVKGSRFVVGRWVIGHHSLSAARQSVLADRVQRSVRRRPHRPVLRLLRVSPSLSGPSGPFGDRVRNRG